MLSTTKASFFLVLLVVAQRVRRSRSFLSRPPISASCCRIDRPSKRGAESLILIVNKASTMADMDSLMDMDIVIYSLKDDPSKERIGAIQEDGTLSPLSVWSDEPVFGDSLEFLVDEEDRFPGITANDCVIHRLVPQECLSYGSRQVGGGKGPGNPHGEESELLYYVHEKIITNVELAVKPELEILW